MDHIIPKICTASAKVNMKHVLKEQNLHVNFWNRTNASKIGDYPLNDNKNRNKSLKNRKKLLKKNLHVNFLKRTNNFIQK